MLNAGISLTMTERNAIVELNDPQAPLRVLIVDDEPLARSRLARLCERRMDVHVVAQAGSGADAIIAIRAHYPDLVLLDIELGDMNGFDVLRSFSAQEQPHAILVTAHAEHAVAGFESDVIHYLTKPIDENRFNQAIERARARCAATLPQLKQSISRAVCAALSGEMKQRSAPLWLVAERGRRVYFIETTDVEYIECAGNYASIHTEHDHYIIRSTLKRFTEPFKPLGFIRIARPLLLNFKRVSFAERLGKGCYAFTLRSGKRLVSSAPHRKAILDEIRQGCA